MLFEAGHTIFQSGMLVVMDRILPNVLFSHLEGTDYLVFNHVSIFSTTSVRSVSSLVSNLYSSFARSAFSSWLMGVVFHRGMLSQQINKSSKIELRKRTLGRSRLAAKRSAIPAMFRLFGRKPARSQDRTPGDELLPVVGVRVRACDAANSGWTKSYRKHQS